MVQDDRYTLATGESGAKRLHILHAVHKPYTEHLFQRVGLSPNLRVADIGCGIGSVSNWLASQVLPNGSVVGVDTSAEQIEQAQRNANVLGLSNVTFVKGSAYNTGLPLESFDLVYCRFLLMHLARPTDALQEMLSLVKPGGLLVCEEADFSCAFCDPPRSAHDRTFELLLELGKIRHQHFCMGTQLYRMFADRGLKAEVSIVQPVIVRGENKRLMELSLLEAAGALVEAGLTTHQEIEQIANQMQDSALDETVIFAIAPVTQVWARK